MPSLTPEDRKILLGAIGISCTECGQNYVRGYCRQCDAFYFTCACNTDTGHTGHRTY